MSKKKDKNVDEKKEEMVAEIKETTNEEKEVKQTTNEEKLQQQVEQLEKDLAAAKNAYFRAYADADNLKKRLQADADNASKYRIQSFALAILPALDSLSLALNGKDENDGFVKGVRLTYDSIVNALKNEGVSEIECLNKPFDANVAQAIISEEVEGVGAGIVVEVLQKGYMLKDRLLRAALVKVSQ